MDLEVFPICVTLFIGSPAIISSALVPSTMLKTIGCSKFPRTFTQKLPGNLIINRGGKINL